MRPLTLPYSSAVALESLVAGAAQAEEKTLVARESLIAVLGDGMPERIALEVPPAPLAAVAVPVAEDEIEEPRRQELVDVDLHRGIGLQLVVQLLVPHDLGQTEGAGAIAGSDAMGNSPKKPTAPLNSCRNSPSAGSSGSATRRQDWVWRPAARVEASRHQLARGMLRGHLILEDGLHDRARSSSSMSPETSLASPRNV